MTLIFNFCALGATIICFEVSSRYFRYKEEKIEAAKKFYIAFFFVGLGYVFLSLPQLILFDPFWIQIAFILQDVLFLASLLFIAPAAIGMFDKWSRFKKPLHSIILFWIGLYIIFNVIFFSPAVPLKASGIIYFWKSGTLWLQSMGRALLVVLALTMSALFLAWAKRTSLRKRIAWRAFFSALAGLLISSAGFVFWFFPFFYFSPGLLVFSGCLGFLGFFVGWVGSGWIGGVVLRPNGKELVKKII